MSDRPNNTLNERHVSLLVRFWSAFTPEISHEGHLEPEEVIFFFFAIFHTNTSLIFILARYVFKSKIKHKTNHRPMHILIFGDFSINAKTCDESIDETLA